MEISYARCIDEDLASSDRLNASEKAHVKFDVEKTWKPDEVNVLFILESPPWNGKQRYFYRQDVVENHTNRARLRNRKERTEIS